LKLFLQRPIGGPEFNVPNIFRGAWAGRKVADKLDYFIGKPYIVRENGFTYHCPADRYWIMQFASYAQEEITREIQKEEGGLFVDVGAGLGKFSMIASRQGMDVIALEPMKTNYHAVVQNFNENKTIGVVLDYAAWNRDGYETFYESPHADQGSLGDRDWIGRKPKDSYLVKVVKLDTLLHERKPRIVKIDVEGKGLKVLHGMKDMLKLGTKVIYEANVPVELQLQKDFLEAQGYRTEQIGERNFMAVPVV
jgi:FkbM family methyltransferase